MRANAQNIQHWLEKINTYNATPEVGEGTTRILFTEPELQARAYIKAEMRALGLTVHEDAIGNIFATLKGEDTDASPVWTGSHIDTVPNAGMFDGMAGIVSGMEALRMIRESGAVHKRDIAVVVYTSEEPTRFGLSCLGSRALAGVMSTEDTQGIFDKDGKSLYDVLDALGYDQREYDTISKKCGQVHASVELHVEQNSNLERCGKAVGLVTGICAPTNLTVKLHGVQSHAGGTPMSVRKDAFAAACELSLRFEQLTKQSKGEYVTGTVGCVKVYPNAVNVIPGEVEITLDIRSIDMESKDVLLKQLNEEIQHISQRRGVVIGYTMENHDVPLRCDAHVLEVMHEVCSQSDIPYMELVSGPYHDSLFVGHFCPTAMLFVPSRNGISHSKDEWTDFEDIAAGTDVLAQTLLRLANEE